MADFPAPTREIVEDYLSTVDAGLCTRQCGAARDDICICRCGGEFHNLLRDWWASSEYRTTGKHWCTSCQRAHEGPLGPGNYVLNCGRSPELGRHLAWLESIGCKTCIGCRWQFRRYGWVRMNTAPGCPEHDHR